MFLDELRREDALSFLLGSDMAIAFLEHIVGPRLARIIRGQMEVTEIQEEDDPFAAFHNLV